MTSQLIISENIKLSPALTLEDCEQDIELANQLEELSHYVKGKRLSQIKDSKWYTKHGNWEDYCRTRWGYSKQHADNLIRVASAIENLILEDNLPILPQTYRQARPLIGLDPEQQREVWKEAVETAPRKSVKGISINQDIKISGRHVKETLEKMYPKGDDNGSKTSETSFNDVSHLQVDKFSEVLPSSELESAIQKSTVDWSDSELQRKDLVLQGETVIANKKHDKALIQWAQKQGLYVAIDRGSIWGNPFVLPDDGNRNDVIEKYRWYYEKKPSLQVFTQQKMGRRG